MLFCCNYAAKVPLSFPIENLLVWEDDGSRDFEVSLRTHRHRVCDCRSQIDWNVSRLRLLFRSWSFEGP